MYTEPNLSDVNFVSPPAPPQGTHTVVDSHTTEVTGWLGLPNPTYHGELFVVLPSKNGDFPEFLSEQALPGGSGKDILWSHKY